MMLRSTILLQLAMILLPPPSSARAAFTAPAHDRSNCNADRHITAPPYCRPSTALRNHKHIKIATATNNNKHRRSSHPNDGSSDRLRVELMRSQLSCNLAEQRARRLEVELKEERRRCDALRVELERARTSSSTRGVAAAKNGAVGRSSAPFAGSSLDDLPPFAAALAANAEREEMAKRRRLGLLDEDDTDSVGDGYSDGSDLDGADGGRGELVLNLGLDVTSDSNAEIETWHEQVASDELLDNNTSSSSAELAGHNNLHSQPNRTSAQSTAVSTLASNKTAELETSLQFSAEANQNTGTNTDYTNLFSTINNSTINRLNSQYTPQYINDDMQTLRQNCILLTHQRAALQHKLKQSESARKSLEIQLKSTSTSLKVLRGLQSDWTRRLSEARKDMDGQRDKWQKEMKVKTREYKAKEHALERQITTLSTRCDELNKLLENQNNITFVMGLFCRLAKRHVLDTLKDGRQYVTNSRHEIGYRIRYGTRPRPNRMLTVGGADGMMDVDEGIKRDGISRFSKVFSGMARRFKSLKRIRREELPTDDTSPAAASILCDATTIGETTILPSLERMPQLILKNPRRSTLSQPAAVFQRRIRDVDDLNSLPDFMKID